MFASGRQGERQRIYSITVLVIVGVVAMVLLMTAKHLTMAKYRITTYSHPHKVLLSLAEVQVRFFRGDSDQDGRRDFATSLEELSLAGMITDELATGEVEGYRYRIVPPPPIGWGMTAEPVEVTSSSIFYYIDHTQVIRARLGRTADATSRVYYDPLQGYTGALGLHQANTPHEAK
jgi:competence protein ComGC